MIVRALVVLAVLLACAGVALADEPAAPASPEAIVAYHDSGEWSADTTQVVRRARRYVRRHLDDSSRRAAIVLDIDDTSLSNYECLKASASTARRPTRRTDLPAISQRAAFSGGGERGVAVFVNTPDGGGGARRGRPPPAGGGYAALDAQAAADDQPRRWRAG